MMRKGLWAYAALVSIPFLIAPVWAQDSSDSADTPGVGFANPVRISGSLVGNGDTSAGGCATGFSQCPNGDSCTCLTVMGARFSASRIGAGRANLFLTFDNTATFGALGNDCTPIYGELDAIAKKDSPQFSVWGAACDTDTAGNQAANGALGMSNSNLFLTSGYATFTSSISKNGHVNLKFSGRAQ